MPQRVLRGLLLGISFCNVFDSLFASARPARIASRGNTAEKACFYLCLSASCADCFNTYLPASYYMELCLSASCADCFWTSTRRLSSAQALPQRVLRGLLPAETRRRLAPAALPQRVLRGLLLDPLKSGAREKPFASARPARIASAKTHKVKPAFMMDDAVSR